MRRTIFACGSLFLPACLASVGAVPGSAGEDDGAAASDTVAPVVELSSPVRGAFLDATEGRPIEVAGRVVDDGTIVSLTIDGRGVALDRGRFRYEDDDPAPGLRTYTVEARDAAGNLGSATASVLYGAYGLGPLAGAVRGALGPAALESTAHALEAALEALDWEALVRDEGPISESLRVDAVRRGDIRVALVPSSAGIGVTVAVDDVEVELSYAGLFEADVFARADQASVGATLRLGLTTDGSIEVTLEDPSSTLDGFVFDVSGVGGEDVLRDPVEEALEAQLVRLLRQQVPPRIAEQIEALPQSWSFAAGGGGTALVRLDELRADPGGVRVVASVDVQAARAAVAPDSPGSLRTSGRPPSLDVDGLAAAVSDDLLNALLHARWAAGDMHRTIALGSEQSPTTVSVVTLVLPALDGAAPSDAPVQLVIEPLLPAVVEHDPQGGVSVAIGELHLRLEALTPEGPVTLVTLAGRVDVAVALALEPEGDLSISVADWTLRAEPLEPDPDLPRGPELEQLLAGVLEMFSIDLAGPLASIPLPIPDALALEALQVSAAGPAADWLLLRCDVAAR